MAVLLRVLLIIIGFTGIHSIKTVSKVSVKAGDSISIPCLYASRYLNHVKYLCKGYDWSSCTTVITTNQQSSEKYSISDNKSQRIFNVTINDLTDEDTDYWCVVEINNAVDDGEYFELSVKSGTPKLYVDKQQITGFKGDDVTIDCNYRNGGAMKWCRLSSSCVTPPSGSINGTGVSIDASVSNVFTVTMSGLNTESTGWYWCVKGGFQMPVYVTVDELTTTTTTTTTTAMSSTTAIIRSDSTQTLPTTTQISSPLTSEEPHTAQPTNSGTGEESSSMVTVLTSTLVPLLLLIPAAFVAWRLIGRNKTKPEGSEFAADSQIGSVPDVLYTTIVHNQHAAAQQKTEPVDGSVIYSILLPQNMGQLAEKKERP